METGTGRRIGDDERSATIEQLTDHVAAGRLAPDEFDERADLALRARTQGQLEVLTADLQARPTPRPPATPVVSLTPLDLVKALGVVVALGMVSMFVGDWLFGYANPTQAGLVLWVVSCLGAALGAAVRSSGRSPRR